MVQLALGQVQADGMGSGLGESDRPLRSPATELEDVLAGDLPQDAQLRFGDLGRAPVQTTGLGQLAAVSRLIPVAFRVPQLAVADLVIAQPVQVGRGWRLVGRGSIPWRC